MEDKSIFVNDNKGNKLAGEIVFTFEANGDDFVLYELENDHKVYAGKVDEEGNLKKIEDDEWKLIEKVYDQYIEENGEEDVD